MLRLFLVPIVSVFLLAMSAGAQMPVDSATTSPSSSALMPAQSADGKWGYQDKSGTFTIPAQYDRAERFSEGLAVVQQKKQFGYVDSTGQIVIPLQFVHADPFSEGLAQVYTTSGMERASILILTKLRSFTVLGREYPNRTSQPRGDVLRR